MWCLQCNLKTRIKKIDPSIRAYTMDFFFFSPLYKDLGRPRTPGLRLIKFASSEQEMKFLSSKCAMRIGVVGAGKEGNVWVCCNKRHKGISCEYEKSLREWPAKVHFE